jgi:hypothetical protein
MGKASRSAATAISPAGLGGQGRWNALGRWRGLRAYPRGRGVENHQYAPQGRQRGMRKPPPGWDRRRFSRGRWPYGPAGAGVIRNPCDKCRRQSPYVRCWVNSGNLMLALTFSAFDPGCVKTYLSQGRSELFSQLVSARSTYQCDWFPRRRSRDGNSTRKSSV